MAKVNFELVKASITEQSFGSCHKREWARCDLALPALELRAIAAIMDALPWVEQAAEQDGALMIRPNHRVAWLAQERAFHDALAIARRRVSAMLHHLRTETPGETPEPVLVNAYVSDHRGARASVAGGGATYVMPDGHYGPGFAVEEDGDGVVTGYFLTTDNYDDKRKPLASALLGCLFPELGVRTWHRLKSWGEVEMDADARHVGALERHNNLRDHGVACYKAAVQLIESCRREVASLQWKGEPSVFRDEDDDARDWLLGQMRAGATIDCVRIEGADYNDVDGVWKFTLCDGTPLAHYIVTRLQNSEAILPEGYPFEHRREPGEPPAPLAFNAIAKAAVVEPRRSCVPFQAFQSYCAYRRHDGNRECAHPTSGGDYCGAGYCPITTQVYIQDVGRYGMSYDEDPAFEDRDWDHDSMVYAHHRNTERSYAWRAAGKDAVAAIVNMLIADTYQMGVPQRLIGPENMRAARQAIADGWLVLRQEMPGFGIVVALGDTTRARIDAQIAERDAQRAAEAVDA